MHATNRSEPSAYAHPVPPVMPENWPNITFDDTARVQLTNVRQFFDALDTQRHPKAAEIRAEFESRMDYLDGYGGTVSETDARRRFKVTLYGDWADLSFSVSWRYLDQKTGEYVSWMSGGFVWHGGQNDPLCVTLVPQWWGIHT